MTRHFSILALLAGTSLLCAAASAQEAPAPSGPADLCKELLAFVKPAEAPPAPAAAPQQQATAVSTPTNNKDGAQPSNVAGETQQKSGLSGPVPTSGPSPTPTFNETHARANADAKGAPPPGTPKPAPKPEPAAIAAVEAGAAANDQAACRAAAQTMRKAGVALPPPLIALAALDPKFTSRP